ncbi:MAG: flagellar export protein FliJ [Treponema sp.]|jgi:flagellar FliJ protein|nr:flagellar export protein FliJ [Treponema sp.]
MKKFNFSLQKVLQLRKYKEEESKIALGQAIGVLSAIENEIKETAMKRHRATTERFADTSRIIEWSHYITRLEQEAEALTEKAAQAELVVEEKRAQYLEASRELKAMEKLKEKKQHEYRKEVFASETAERDAIAAARR